MGKERNHFQGSSVQRSGDLRFAGPGPRCHSQALPHECSPSGTHKSPTRSLPFQPRRPPTAPSSPTATATSAWVAPRRRAVRRTSSPAPTADDRVRLTGGWATGAGWSQGPPAIVAIHRDPMRQLNSQDWKWGKNCNPNILLGPNSQSPNVTKHRVLA